MGADLLAKWTGKGDSDRDSLRTNGSRAGG